MGDKSPKSKARQQKQHAAEKKQKRNDAIARQTPPVKPVLQSGG